MSLMTDLNVCSELVVLRVPRVELHEECICDSHYIYAASQPDFATSTGTDAPHTSDDEIWINNWCILSILYVLWLLYVTNELLHDMYYNYWNVIGRQARSMISDYHNVILYFWLLNVMYNDYCIILMIELHTYEICARIIIFIYNGCFAFLWRIMTFANDYGLIVRDSPRFNVSRFINRLCSHIMQPCIVSFRFLFKVWPALHFKHNVYP